MNHLSPRKDFLKREVEKKAHQDLVTTGSFRATCQAVLAEYAIRLPSANTPASSWNNACKLEGARDALNLLLTFAESQEPMKTSQTPNLNPV